MEETIFVELLESEFQSDLLSLIKIWFDDNESDIELISIRFSSKPFICEILYKVK